MHYAHYALCTLCIMHIMHYAHYALWTLCIMHIMHHAGYALCTICILHVMHYAHYALCTLCIMHIIHYAHYVLCTWCMMHICIMRIMHYAHDALCTLCIIDFTSTMIPHPSHIDPTFILHWSNIVDWYWVTNMFNVIMAPILIPFYQSGYGEKDRDYETDFTFIPHSPPPSQEVFLSCVLPNLFQRYGVRRRLRWLALLFSAPLFSDLVWFPAAERKIFLEIKNFLIYLKSLI